MQPTDASPNSSELEQRLADRSNHFNLIRLGLALTVCLDHAGLLIHGEKGTEMVSVFGVSLGYMAVNGFFILSGLLICRSAESKGIGFNYISARVLRLYPALIVFGLVATLIIGPIVSAKPYWGDLRTFSYLSEILRFGDTSGSPIGFYPNNPYPLEYASPLWTLRYEVLCYLAAPILVLIGAHKSKTLLLILIVLVGLIVAFLEPSKPRFELPAVLLQSARFGFCFLIGMVIWVFREDFTLSTMYVVGALVIFILCAVLGLGKDVPITLFMAVLVLWLGLIPKRTNSKVGETDVSYGVYIWHYPIMQVLVGSFAVSSSGTLLILGIAITLPIAWLSWTLVEKPAQNLKYHIR